eukprot:7166612-Prymnesium_polylepis.1
MLPGKHPRNVPRNVPISVLIRLDPTTTRSAAQWVGLTDAEAVDDARVDRGRGPARSRAKKTRTRALGETRVSCPRREYFFRSFLPYSS